MPVRALRGSRLPHNKRDDVLIADHGRHQDSAERAKPKVR